MFLFLSIFLFGMVAGVNATDLDGNMETNFCEPFSKACVKPDYLKPGDKVALISPSSYVAMERVEQTAAVLRGWGLVPVIGPNVGKKAGLNDAGTKEERLSDLRWAFSDDEVKAIICNRGGYGSIHMVPEISLKGLASKPKWIVGFSDITTYHAMEVCAGVMSIHGTMSTFIGPNEGKDISSLTLRDLLFGRIPEYRISPNPYNQTGKATGTLVGGNLCTFFPLLGSAIDFTNRDEGIILFIEEVGEPFHNIDRLLNMLVITGVIDRCKGVILGEFTDCRADLDFESVEQMISQYLKKYDIPVIYGFPAGHDSPNLPLVMGATTTIEVSQTQARVSFALDGEKSVVDLTNPQPAK